MCEACTTGRARAQRHVVAVEGDVDVAERDLVADQLGDQLAQARGERGAAAMDADDGELLRGVLLDDLVRDAHERAPHVVAVEDDLLGFQPEPSWPHGTGLKERTLRSVAVSPTPRAAVCGALRLGGRGGARSLCTSSGAPRSGNGISIASKSRGTTVSGKTARASSRISRPP